MSLPPTHAAAATPPGPAIELRLALRLLPTSDGLGCGWQFSAQAGEAPPLYFSSLAELVDHLARLAHGAAPPRGIR
jgi:hypothetical protein